MPSFTFSSEKELKRFLIAFAVFRKAEFNHGNVFLVDDFVELHAHRIVRGDFKDKPTSPPADYYSFSLTVCREAGVV